MLRSQLKRRYPTNVLITVIGLILMTMNYSCEDLRVGDGDRLDRMHAEILEETDAADCNDSTQCRYIALGSKPCGGPWEYLIYCAAEMDTAELEQLVEEYNQYEDELNRKYGRVSDCSVPPEPQLGFLGGYCVDLREPYQYQAYDSLGVLVVEGWFRIETQDSTFISGVWDFDPVGNPENIGPQTGNGFFTGQQEGDWIRMELNPDMVDNNVSLYGTFTGTVINGEWQFTGFPGLINEGSFYAEK